jgi:phosphatidate cytidylyltransferase
MLIKRTYTSLALAAIGIPAIILGKGYYFGLIMIFLVGAAWEYGRIFRKVDIQVSEPLLIGSVVLIASARTKIVTGLLEGGLGIKFPPELAAGILTLSILAAMTWHLLAYEKGREHAATDFAVTVAGIAYLGWIGTYLIDLRNLSGGLWWVVIVLPTIWLADMAAYFVGRKYGKHLLSPRLSPKKTWEGYWAGVVFGTLSAVGLVVLWQRLGAIWHWPDVPVLTWWKGAALGLGLSVLTTLGDLGESMFKRQAGVKDSSNIFPGHGGFLDRIDSWLWGAALGCLLITWFHLG